jgi:hypothetical protein
MHPPHLLVFAKYLLSDANRTSKLRWPDFWQIVMRVRCDTRGMSTGAADLSATPS